MCCWLLESGFLYLGSHWVQQGEVVSRVNLFDGFCIFKRNTRHCCLRRCSLPYRKWPFQRFKCAKHWLFIVGIFLLVTAVQSLNRRNNVAFVQSDVLIHLWATIKMGMFPSSVPLNVDKDQQRKNNCSVQLHRGRKGREESVFDSEHTPQRWVMQSALWPFLFL